MHSCERRWSEKGVRRDYLTSRNYGKAAIAPVRLFFDIIRLFLDYYVKLSVVRYLVISFKSYIKTFLLVYFVIYLKNHALLLLVELNCKIIVDVYCYDIVKSILLGACLCYLPVVRMYLLDDFGLNSLIKAFQRTMNVLIRKRKSRKLCLEGVWCSVVFHI